MRESKLVHTVKSVFHQEGVAAASSYTTFACTLAGGLALTGAAGATTLTFDLTAGVTGGSTPGAHGDNVSGANADGSGTGVSAAGSYGVGAEGATPNVSVDYNGPDPRLFPSGYSSLTTILYDGNTPGQAFGLTLTAESGYEVTLSSFDLGNFRTYDVTIPGISVFADGVEQFCAVDFILPARDDAPLAYVKGQVVELLFTTTGLGDDTDIIGVDNVLFSQSAIVTPLSDPQPHTLTCGPATLAGWFGRVRAFAATRLNISVFHDQVKRGGFAPFFL